MSNVGSFFPFFFLLVWYERTSTWQFMKTARFMCFAGKSLFFFFSLWLLKLFFFAPDSQVTFTHLCLPSERYPFRMSIFCGFFFRESSRTISGCWNEMKQMKLKKNQLNTHRVHAYPYPMVDVNTLTSTTPVSLRPSHTYTCA